MSYSVTTKKTWARILDDIEDSFAKWGGVAQGWRVYARREQRSAAKQYQTTDERRVTLRWRRREKDYTITMQRQSRAVDNLLVIWLILETLRLNDARGYAEQIAEVYRTEFPALPAPGQSTQAAHPRPVDGAYALLHVRSNAPIEVCEAAYRALSKLFHPDRTGSTATQQSLNAAIEQIRKERGT